jgi:hypothetical protein
MKSRNDWRGLPASGAGGCAPNCNPYETASRHRRQVGLRSAKENDRNGPDCPSPCPNDGNEKLQISECVPALQSGGSDEANAVDIS